MSGGVSNVGVPTVGLCELEQEAQLSQRDRTTAAWVNFGQHITER